MKNITFRGISIAVLMSISGMVSAGPIVIGLGGYNHNHIINPEYDFGHEAIGNEHAAYSMNLNNGVTANAYNLSDPSIPLYAYLDDFSAGKEAGLGVCETLNHNGSCYQDNVGKNEVIGLSFNNEITIDQIEFHNGNHKGWFHPTKGQVSISVDGSGFTPYALSHIFNTSLTGTNFLFANTSLGHHASAGKEFYITALNTQVVTPIPAAVWLFVSGLGSLGLFRKRKKGLNAIAA
ncbi:MAG: VPLPA-CTERM sorting domain-containing protein [Methylococcales bacterium]|nr:VPLPA-CTERM sorting domain-containing protein [Methylococcales bacterium]